MSRRKRKNLTHAEVEVDGAEPPVEPAAAAPSDEPTTRVETEEIERLRAEASEMRDLAQRKQAEFENYRKRMERERLDLSRYAEADVVKEVLPVLDNLERALRAEGSEGQLRDGVVIIHKQLQEILSRLGLSEVESLGKPFDPHIHEAVSQVESSDRADGTVLEVFQKGYLFKDRLLRPAMVSVARRPPGESEDEDTARGASGDENEALPSPE
jgi:molecular chaperone GrpE